MTLQTTATRQSNHYSLSSTMDSTGDKEERKREYNRLAQREFRRRRKEHLKNLEQMQKEQSTEQSEEIERLRYQNDELRRENEALRSQLYGSSTSSSSHLMASAPISVPDNRQYSLSPSISSTSISGTGSPPASLGSDLMPMAALSLSSSSMLPPQSHAYADSAALSSQSYSMVHPSGLRHTNSQSSPESSGFRNSRSSVGSAFQSLNTAAQSTTDRPTSTGQRRISGQPSMIMVPYDRNKARSELLELFQPLINDPAVGTDSQHHLSVLRSMSDSLPASLKPCKVQLDTPHYYGIDMVASPSLRESLCTVTSEVARSFVAELGIIGNEREEVAQVIIWGEEPLNEMSWEVSQPLLDRWGWLLGSGWVRRANFWRRQRGAPLLPEW